MKRMLINATHPEELRVALVDGQRLFDLDIESSSREQKKANIYKGRITRVEPSLEAAFVDFGADRHGFLPLKEISRDYFKKSPGQIEGKVNIKEVVAEGQEVIVQVDKEERGNKGAALTTFISLAGRYLVLMPNNPRAGGISRRIEGEERAQLKEAMNSVQVPKSMGIIVRTAGIGRTTEELQWDLDYLVQFWEAITQAAGERKAPFLIHQESNVIIRAVRDYLRQDIGEVLIDSEGVYEDVLNFVRAVMPTFENKIKLYKDEIPLFSRYQIEGQIETAFQREVRLPSGGSIVIDPTEALVSIDINSSRATKGQDIEETAFQTNLEAAEEIARQLRLRDMGGLIVIDFIDMTPARHQREVEQKMREALEIDRARVQVGKISRFGLLEMSRQRLRPSLGETRSEVCPRCEGQGTIRGIESLALSIMRLIYEESSKEKTGEVRAIVPVSVATFLLNEKRKQLADIEARQEVSVVVVPVPHMETPHFEILRMRDDETTPEHVSSHQVAQEYSEREEDVFEAPAAEKPVREQAAVRAIRPSASAPSAPTANATETTEAAPAEQDDGLFRRIGRKIACFFSDEESQPSKTRDTANKDAANRGDQRNQVRQDRRKTRVARDGQSSGNNNRNSNERRQSNNQKNSGDDTRSRGRNRNDDQNRPNQSRQADDRSADKSTESKGVDNRNDDSRRDSRRDSQNRGQNRSRPQRDAKNNSDQKDANQQESPQKAPATEKSGSDDSRRKPRRPRNRDGSSSENPASSPAARKSARNEKHQKDTQPEAGSDNTDLKAATATDKSANKAITKAPVAQQSEPKQSEQKTASETKPAQKPQTAADTALAPESETQADPQAQKPAGPATTEAPATAEAPAAKAKPKAAQGEAVTASAQPAKETTADASPKPAAQASETVAGNKPSSEANKAESASKDGEPSATEVKEPSAAKEPSAPEVKEPSAPEVKEPPAAATKEPSAAEAGKSSATEAKEPSVAADKPAVKAARAPSAKEDEKPAANAGAEVSSSDDENKTPPAKKPRATPARSRSKSAAAEKTAAQAPAENAEPAPGKAAPASAEEPAEGTGVSVTPGRAYNDPREVRKRQRAAEEAKKTGGN
ncbi:MAG: ribonuclease E [Marinobacter sp.]|uniref:ribonuclease E n=1 Tax=Marinobacter sp. TaxID=50741 RepID=UPI001B6F1C7A|nr:ribonuclease E [Marinobacter sp.]MBQ0747707.1 ribonuclease E [Marinobacter sp.]MBQ0813304.1 ribonuclease E [Marinobacter sp.]|tara:strand:+ start:39828 stop:43127 length:3300 start_codon:yes stop_codon:yes gene_type:complete